MSQKRTSKRHGSSTGASAACFAYYEAAMRFYSATPWVFIESMVPFAVYPPGASAPLVASVLGAGGEEYGLGVYRGDHAFEHVRALTNGEMGVRLSSEVDALSCMFEQYGRMPKEVRAPILRAGARPKRDALAPWAIAKRPFKKPANPTDEDLALLGTLMDAILAALEKKILPLAGSIETALRIVRTEGSLEVSVEPCCRRAERHHRRHADLARRAGARRGGVRGRRDVLETRRGSPRDHFHGGRGARRPRRAPRTAQRRLRARGSSVAPSHGSAHRAVRAPVRREAASFAASEKCAVTTMDEAKLIAKLRLIEALHAGAATPGERDAAGRAAKRVIEFTEEQKGRP